MTAVGDAKRVVLFYSHRFRVTTIRQQIVCTRGHGALPTPQKVHFHCQQLFGKQEFRFRQSLRGRLGERSRISKKTAAAEPRNAACQGSTRNVIRTDVTEKSETFPCPGPIL